MKLIPPEVTLISAVLALSAYTTRSAMSASRRLQPTAMRKQRPFADGWRKTDVPMLDNAGDDGQIVLYGRRRSY